jgi:hypothetical protein
MRGWGNGDTRSDSVLMWLGLSLILIVLDPTSFAVAQELGEGELADTTAVEPAQETPPPAPSEPWYKTPTKNNLVLSLGGAIWPSLGDKEFGTTSVTSLPGSLNSLGIAFQVAYERPVVHWQRGDLYLGAEFGGFRFDNDQEANSIQATTGNLVKGALDFFAWYAGPSIKFMVGEGPVRLFVGGGVGYYSLKLTESDEVPRPPCTNYGPCFIAKRSLTKSAIGGHVSLGIDFAAHQTQSGWQWRIRLEDDIHLVNYGSLDNFSPGAGGLSGPINVIQIGIIGGF